MKCHIIFVTAIISVLIGQVRSAASDDDVIEKIPLQRQTTKPLTTILLNGKEIGNVNSSVKHTTETLSRVKRQYGYGYGYGRRWYPPFPLPIFTGGGFGGYGGRGFGGRGFGGRGFGGGGRGFGGGFGGRGGGIGGGHAGGVGGGHGGGGGRG